MITRRTIISALTGAGAILALSIAVKSNVIQGGIMPGGEGMSQASGTALLVLDMQLDFLSATGKFPVDKDQAHDVTDVVNMLLAGAKDRGWTPIVIVNSYSAWDFFNLFRNRAAIEGSSGAALDPRVNVGDAPYFTKRVGNAFSNPALVDYLRTHEIGHVIIAGVYAEACVTSTAEGAVRHGLTPIVVANAVASRSDKRREAALSSLRANDVVVANSDDLLDGNWALWRAAATPAR
jgi:nicotinamidase/pyrazinamidase